MELSQECERNPSIYITEYVPKLEDASVVWDLFLKKDIGALERVQRNAARFFSQNYKRYASVTDMIGNFGWDMLEMRRTQFIN